MVPRLDADPLLDALGLPLPAGASSPTSGSSPRTARRGRLDPEFELLDTGVLDDDRYWDITVDYAKAVPDDLCVRVRVRNAGPDEADAPRAADAVVPQHLVVGARRPPAGHRRQGRRARGRAPRASAGWCCVGRPGSPEPPVLRERVERAPAVGRRRAGLTRRTGSATTSCTARRRSTPSAPARRRRSGTASRWPPARPAEVRLRLSRRRHAPWTATCAQVLADREREADEFYAALTPADAERRRGAGAAPGPRRDAVEQAVLPLRRRSLARRRPGPAAAARRALARPQPRVAPPQQRRRHLDARHVGVPLVRGVGPRLPLRAARPRRRRSSPRTSCS